jgi:superfamily II DNA or RNA helicase
MELRDYQQDAVSSVMDAWYVGGYADVLGVAATGAGKTQIFLALLQHVLGMHPERRALIIAHRKELIDQPAERVAGWPNWKPSIGRVMAAYDECDRQITVATVQTLSSQKRLARLLSQGKIDYLVTDEAHHVNAASYLKLVNQLKTVNPELKHLGVTATPMRADGDGLSRVYEHVAFKVSIADLVKRRWLVKPRGLGIATGISLKGVTTRAGDYVSSEVAKRFDTAAGREIVLNAWKEYASDRRTLAFTASVQGAHDLADAFRAEGVSAEALDGSTSKETREEIIRRFKKGEIQVLCNCQVLTEGFDAPGTSCIIMARPTKSDTLYVQCIGRGLRPADRTPAPGEPRGRALPDEDCLILDFVPETERDIVLAGDVLGLPKDMSEAARKDKKDADPGAVQYGFTFDGDDFNADGTPLEIIARQLNYLEVSPYTWHRQSDWLTLGLGKGEDGINRMLAITPPDDDNRCELWAIWRREGERDWRCKSVTVGSIDAVCDKGHELAERNHSPVLNSKGMGWMSEPASEKQIAFLRRVAREALSARRVEALSKGDASRMTSYWLARNAVEAIKEREAAQTA